MTWIAEDMDLGLAICRPVALDHEVVTHAMMDFRGGRPATSPRTSRLEVLSPSKHGFKFAIIVISHPLCDSRAK